jgi:hypothetical protein
MMAKELTHASNGSPRLAILTFLTASNLVALTRIAGNENKLNLHKGPISRVADALSRNSAPSSAQGILESYSVHPRQCVQSLQNRIHILCRKTLQFEALGCNC